LQRNDWERCSSFAKTYGKTCKHLDFGLTTNAWNRPARLCLAPRKPGRYTGLSISLLNPVIARQWSAGTEPEHLIFLVLTKLKWTDTKFSPGNCIFALRESVALMKSTKECRC
jgi:hypothetical protein